VPVLIGRLNRVLRDLEAASHRLRYHQQLKLNSAAAIKSTLFYLSLFFLRKHFISLEWTVGVIALNQSIDFREIIGQTKKCFTFIKSGSVIIFWNGGSTRMSISFALYELYYRFDATNPQENITIIELLMIIHKKEKNIIKRVAHMLLGHGAARVL
jgi:hypothetical protein